MGMIMICDRGAFPTGSKWKALLHELYVNSPHTYGENQQISINDDKHPLARRLHITGYQLMLAMAFLQDHSLVERVLGRNPEFYTCHFKLTVRGFDVAQQNEKNRQELRVQRTIAFATVAGMLFTIYNALIAVLNVTKNPVLFAAAALVIGLIMAFVMGRVVQETLRLV